MKVQLSILGMIAVVVLAAPVATHRAMAQGPGLGPYGVINDLEKQVKAFAKNGGTDEAAAAILEELPHLAERWLDPQWSQSLAYPVEGLQKAIAADRKLLPRLKQEIASIEAGGKTDDAEIAAMYDLVGASAEASEIYASVLTDVPDPPIAVRQHQIRLVGSIDPAGIAKLLEGMPDDYSTRNSLARIFYKTDSFEASLAIIDVLAEYLEKIPDDTPRTFHWVPEMETTFSSIVYGEIQMPPIWRPDSPHDPGYKGRVASREVIELRQRAFERYCRAALKFPGSAAWAFSRVAATADLRGEFEESEALIALAREAVGRAEQPTPFGIFATTNPSPIRISGMGSSNEPRFYSPELYLAYRAWKRGVTGTPADFPEASKPRLDLLRCDPDDFIPMADALIHDKGPVEMVRIGPGRVISEREAEIASRRLGEVLQIWSARGRDVELFDWIIDLNLEFRNGLSARSQKESIRMLTQYLDALARDFGSFRVHDGLEQLAYVFLGRPEERAAEIAQLPSRFSHSEWLSAPARVHYVDLLQAMTSYPALAFPAVEKSIELGIDGRVSLYNWLKSEYFGSAPEMVISRLEFSPLTAELKRFRTFPTESHEAVRTIARNEPTLLDWVIQEIRKLKPEAQAPYRQYLEEKKTFGAAMILASLNPGNGAALQKLLEARNSELRDLPAERLKEIAIFALPRLPERSSALLTLLESTLEDLNPERLQRLVTAFLNGADQFPSEVDAIFASLLQSDPGVAFEALHQLVDSYPKRLAESERERSRNAARNYSFLAEILKKGFWAWKDDEHAKFAFYLRVLGDEKLVDGLIVEDRPFGFEPADSQTIAEYHQHFVDEVAWVTGMLPEDMPPAYLLPAVMSRYGWMRNTAIRAAQTADFQERAMAAAKPEHRDVVRIGLTLGSRRLDWVYGSVPTPGWKEPEVAAAFTEAGEIVGDPGLSLPFRLAAAAMICSDCKWHTSPDLCRQFAALLAESWEADAVVGARQEEKILQVFFYSEQNDAWTKIAKRLISAWRERIGKIDEAGPDAARKANRETIAWLIGISAAAGEDEAQAELTKRLTGLSGARLPLPTVLLVRSGKIGDAADLFARKDDSFVDRDVYASRAKFDLALANELPGFLAAIPDPGERFLAELHLKVLKDDPFADSLPSREGRLIEMASRFGGIDFKRAPAKVTSLRLLAEESAASAIIAEALVAESRLDDLAAIHNSNEVYAWRRLAQDMIVALLKAEKFERTLEVLGQVDAATRKGAGQFSSTWSDLSDSVSAGVSHHQDDLKTLEKMLPLTRYMAALPPEFFKGNRSDRMRAGNYARNIFCHALLDQMDEWRAWRQSLDPELREHLDQLWYPQSGWAIGLTTTRTPDDAPVEHRLAMMKRMLSQPEIVGDRGSLHGGAIRRMASSDLFSTDELLEHGAEIAEVIPDQGQAWRDLADVADAAGQPEQAAGFRKRAGEK